MSTNKSRLRDLVSLVLSKWTICCRKVRRHKKREGCPVLLFLFSSALAIFLCGDLDTLAHATFYEGGKFKCSHQRKIFSNICICLSYIGDIFGYTAPRKSVHPSKERDDSHLSNHWQISELRHLLISQIHKNVFNHIHDMYCYSALRKSCHGVK